MKTLCVITPTISRPTLRRAITSARLTPDDEWLVIGDGSQSEAEAVVESLAILPYLQYVEGPRTRNRGNEQRDLGMSLSDRDYFLFLDDDDVFERGAIDIIRHHLETADKTKPFMFRMHHNGGVIWTSRELFPGNVGGSMFCVPNIPDRLGWWSGWSNEQTSDLEFIESTLQHWDAKNDLVWSGDVIVRCNPERI